MRGGAGPAPVLGGWAPVRAPFPTLRGPLTAAEEILDGGASREHACSWRTLHDVVGDELACARAVDALLAGVLGGWRLVAPEDGQWRVCLVPTPGTPVAELAAAHAIALLVEAGGWSRVLRCAHPRCDRVVLDTTSGGNRRTCRAHQRGP